MREVGVLGFLFFIFNFTALKGIWSTCIWKGFSFFLQADCVCILCNIKAADIYRKSLPSVFSAS